MPVKLTCPVCERSQIEEDICPNCETDLSTYRMLAQLPVETLTETTEQKRTIPIWLPVGIAVFCLLLGVVLGFASNFLFSQQQPSITSTSTTTFNPIPATNPDESTAFSALVEKTQELEQPPTKSCGGFYYQVRSGDSLSLIALRFYGNEQNWQLITQANPQLQGKENFLEIGKKLLIPNLDINCTHQ